MTGEQGCAELPVDLVEALGATPLTYLVPTQSLVNLVRSNDFQISTGDELINDGGATANLRRALTEDGEHLSNYRADMKDFLRIQEQLQNTHVRFNGPEITEVEDSANSSRSVFDELHGLARDLLDETTLIDPSRIIHTVQPAVQPAVQHKLLLQGSKSVSTAPLTQPKRSPLQEHQAQPQDVTLKKRKFDIGVQHLQLQNASAEKLNQLLKKIGMNHEDSEFEDAEIWDEWPNSNHYLCDSILEAIETCIVDIQGTPLLNQVPFNVYKRIQTLAMNSVTAALEMDWDLTVEATQNLKFANTALKASSLILTIFNSKVEEKRLYLDSYLLDCVSFIYKFVEDYLVKLLLDEDSNTTTLVPYLNLVSKILKKFADYIPNRQMNDTLITKLEYLMILIIFQPFDKHLLFFKFSASSLLLSIFESKEGQRSFIIEEILINFDKLTTHKSNSRQVKLPRGVSVQLVTVLLLNFVQCVNLSSTTYANEVTRTPVEYSKEELQARKSEDDRFLKYIQDIKQKRHQILTNITLTLVQKVISNPTPNTKHLVELFIQDLLNIVSHPEWPASEALLGEFTRTIIKISESQNSAVESFLLELIGLIGSKMLELKGITENSSLSFDETNKLNASVYNYLSTLKLSAQFKYCRDFFFTNWVDWIAPMTKPQGDPPSSPEDSAGIIYFGLLSGYYQNMSNGFFAQAETDAYTLEKNAVDAYKQTLLESEFMKLYNEFERHLLKSLNHPKIKSRTRALKNLASLIDKDPRLLTIPQIKQSLSSKINDSSPLVRLAVLDIFERYVFQNPELISDFYKVIILTSDKATSVRTKSIKIAKKVFESKSSEEIRVFALEKIIRRIEDDEETVVELAESTLIDILFLDLIKLSSNVVLFRASILETAKLITSLIDNSETLWELFESFLFEVVIRKSLKNAKFHEILMAACEKMTYYLFSFVIEFMDTDRQEEVEKSLGLLSVFSKAQKPFINQEQLLSLQAYLTGDSVSTNTSYYSLVILRNTLSHTTSLRESFLQKSQTSLLRRLTKFNTRELEQAVPIVWTLSELKKDTTKVANAALSCLVLIKPFVEKALKGNLGKVEPKNLRLIYLIGSFGKYCDLEKNRNLFENSKHISLKPTESVLSLIVKNVMVFTKPTINRQIRRVAVRNLIQVCSSHAKLFMSEPILKVLDEEFKGPHVDFKEVIIQGLLEFLQKEEKKAIESTGYEEKKSAKVGLDVDVFHGNSKSFENDGICASLVQRYMEPILELCLTEDGGISFLAVKYLKFIVKLGFANPRLCIPTVIALQASPVQYIKTAGLELHRELHERYESLVESSYLSGIRLAVEFRSRVSTNLLSESPLFFQKFYNIIKDSKSSKKKVFNQLVKSFNFKIESIDTNKAKDLQFYVLFLTMNLAECEFDSYEEIFVILEGVESILSSQGIPLSKIINSKLQEQNTDINDANIRLAFLSSVAITLHRLVANMRHTYKLIDNVNKEELKAQKPKVTDKVQLPITVFDPSQRGPATVFQELNSLQL